MAKPKVKGRRLQEKQSAIARRQQLRTDKPDTLGAEEQPTEPEAPEHSSCEPQTSDAAAAPQSEPSRQESEDAETLRLPPVRGLGPTSAIRVS